jgi:hypothetical protein
VHELCRVEQTFQGEHRIANALSGLGIMKTVGDFAGRGFHCLVVERFEGFPFRLYQLRPRLIVNGAGQIRVGESPLGSANRAWRRCG